MLENRRAEMFKCLQCGFSADAEHVGALSILSRFYEESEVPHVGRSRDE
jgi:transposase